MDLKTRLEMSLAEDVPTRDVSADLVYGSGQLCEAQIVSKQAAVFYGAAVVTQLCQLAAVTVMTCVSDGTPLAVGDVICRLTGDVKDVLRVERTLLNLVQRLSGIATTTAAYVQALDDASIGILDTRKTTPLWRDLEKQAVVAGGGVNHRQSLSDMVLLKENHLAVLADANRLADLGGLITRFRQENPGVLVEVEVETCQELETLALQDVDVIMFDNFSLTDVVLGAAICKTRGLNAALEVSGNVSVDSISQYRGLPIDRIAIGRLTHSVEAVDLSLRVI